MASDQPGTTPFVDTRALLGTNSQFTFASELPVVWGLGLAFVGTRFAMGGAVGRTVRRF